MRGGALTTAETPATKSHHLGGIDCRGVFAIPGKKQQVPKKVSIQLHMESARYAMSAQCVVERVVVVPDMMDIVICVDHSCLF